MIAPEVALGLVRALTLASGTFVFGTSGLLWLCHAEDTRDVADALRRPVRTAVGVLLLASAAFFPVLAAVAGDGWSDAADLSHVVTLASSTVSGQAALVRLALAATLALTLLSGHAGGHVAVRKHVLLAGGAIATFAMTGHAVLHDGALGRFHQCNHVVHVLAGGFWVGALPLLLTAVHHARGARDRAGAGRLLARFAAIGGVAVLLIAVTGGLNTALVLGRLPTDWSSAYQILLAAKIALVGLMLLLAGLNRFWLVPAAAASETAWHRLAISIAVELVAGISVVALVAVFGTMEPV